MSIGKAIRRFVIGDLTSDDLPPAKSEREDQRKAPERDQRGEKR